MAMLIRRSVRGGLFRRAGATLLPASRQTEVIPSLAASFLSSSAAGAAARIRGSPIRSKGQFIHRMLCDGSGSTQVGRSKPMFLGMMKGLSKELVKRYWTPLRINEKVNTVAFAVFSAWWIKNIFEMKAMQRSLQAMLDEKHRHASTRDLHKKNAA